MCLLSGVLSHSVRLLGLCWVLLNQSASSRSNDGVVLVLIAATRDGGGRRAGRIKLSRVQTCGFEGGDETPSES